VILNKEADRTLSP